MLRALANLVLNQALTLSDVCSCDLHQSNTGGIDSAFVGFVVIRLSLVGA